MLFERVYDEGLAQAGYFVGCQATGEAVVVDPRRDVGVYLRLAEKNGMRIVAVTETHIHADYVSGSRELAAATGAKLYLSDEGDAEWKYGFEAERLEGGDEILAGNIVLRALHTPGHTPEHLSFTVTDGAATREPGFILTGDFVFVGDLGRPDLLDEAVGGKDTRFVGARQMFRSLRNRFLSLPDYVQVWPGHGAGSACGKALGAVPATTVGYERRFSWWAPYLERDDERGFVEALIDGQPDVPAYFARMKQVNKAGPAVLGRRAAPRRHEAEELGARVRAGEVLFVDARSVEDYRAGAVPGSLHVPAGKSFAEWAAWVIDPRTDPPIVLLAKDEYEAEMLRDELSRVGIDAVDGYVTDVEGMATEAVPAVDAGKLDGIEDVFVLDVRSRAEFEAGGIPGATRIPGGRVRWRLEEVPRDREVLVHCQSGARSAVVASLLRASGHERVVELEGGYPAWADIQDQAVAR